MIIKVSLLLLLISCLSCQNSNNTNTTQSNNTKNIEIYNNPHIGKLLEFENRSLYVYLLDLPNNSTCYGECAKIFEPLVENGIKILAPKGLEGSMFGRITRRDGTKQVTFNGYSLYRYSLDKRHQTKGHMMNNTFYLMSAKGFPIMNKLNTTSFLVTA